MTSADRPSDSWLLLPPPEIMVSADVAAVPQIPFAALRGSVVPVHDDDGDLVDWAIAATAFEDPGVVAAYWDWRRRWRRQWPLGPVTNIAALLRTAEEIQHPVGPSLGALLPLLRSLDDEPLTWTPTDPDGLLADLEALRVALVDTVEAGPGAGIVDTTPGSGRTAGLARTWVPDDVEFVLAATSRTAVVVRPGDGLVLMHGSPTPQAFEWVTEVDLRGDEVVVLDDLGNRLELDPDDARPLAWLVPRAIRWHVRTVPLVTVWTTLFVGLPEALAAATAGGHRLQFTTTAPVV